MEFKDYYQILGIKKNATEKEIKSAYRKLARKFHPDLNPNDKTAEKKFKEINEANEVLSNPENRKKYDQYGKDWKHGEEFEKAKQQQRQQQSSRQSYSGAGFDNQDFSDYFESMFGGGARGSARGGQPKFKGQDYQAEMQLDIKDVFEKHSRVLTVNNKKIRLTIPAGIKNGQIIKITGKGAPGSNGGPNGDLYITFTIINNTPFKRDEATLYSDVELDLYTAILGGEINVDTFDGKVKLKVKPETQSETKVKLKGKGFPVYKKDGQFGDLIITYHVKTPTNLSQKEKDLFKELQNLKAK